MMEPELRKTKILKNDIPISSVDEDLFNRKGFAEIIANSIQSYSQSSSRSFVFGISGEWGSGKTSTINMVKGILSKPKDDERFRIIEFTPWFFHGGSGVGFGIPDPVCHSVERCRSAIQNNRCKSLGTCTGSLAT
jgi:hypothetical protein